MTADQHTRMVRLAIQEECNTKSPCQGFKLAMQHDVIVAVNGESATTIPADGFNLPDEQKFFALMRHVDAGVMTIDECLPIEVCPFCGSYDYASNGAPAALK